MTLGIDLMTRRPHSSAIGREKWGEGRERIREGRREREE